MWTDLVAVIPRFSSAVLTFRDPDGYPFSVRCHAEPDGTTETFLVDVSAGVPIAAGPAGLLWHSFDNQLWNQQSYSTRGQLQHTQSGWRYTPTHFSPGAGVGGVLTMLGFIAGARRTTRHYLRRRHLARPRIPWQDINQIKKQTLGH